MIAMHETESDDRVALHRATRVRKNHTSRRDAFETVGGQPLGTVDYETGEVSFAKDYRERDAVDLSATVALETEVELLKFTPGMDATCLAMLRDKEGVIIEGTGLGHVHTDLIPDIEGLVDGGTTVVMTSQCLEGRVCDRVYDTGRDLLDAGVVEGGDMLPGTALVKLMWVLANRADVEAAMRTSIAGELTDRSVPWV
jgi:glutamyl-tRNA(Gln) amidotransferase subunit D